ncbi:GNAT family N-acetyltransferase [Phormidesmis sp. 146-33]
MSYYIRNATPDDISNLAKLITVFMQETFQRPWGGTLQKLAQDGFGREFEMMVAEAEPQTLIAFAAWESSYDLHHCLKGGVVIDLFVDPIHRGRGVAIQLITAIAVKIQQQGGSYIAAHTSKGRRSRTQAFNGFINAVPDVFREPIVMCLGGLSGNSPNYRVKVCATW